jgi:hypothetical protein
MHISSWNMRPTFSAGSCLLKCNLLLVWLLLGACGGGSDSGGVNNGAINNGANGGQQPDPVVADLPIAYVQRTIPVDEDGVAQFPNVFMPSAFNPGAELIIKDRATAQAAVVNITQQAFADDPNFTPATPNYDVKNLSAHPSGDRIIFSMRAPADPDLDDDEQPRWNIWEYHLTTKLLRRVISANFEAEKGDDLNPQYLPDGRILFTSNRQKRSKEVLLDEGKPQFAATTTQDGDIASLLLHSMKDDGSDIEQLSFNQSHDIEPRVMLDGRVLFMRWEGEHLSFYTANPNGTDLQRYSGYQSLNIEPLDTTQTTARLFNPLVLPDDRIAAIYMHNETNLGGDMVLLDGRTNAEATPASISIKPVNIAPETVSLHGRFASLAPLYDGTNRLLVSWSQCRLQEEVSLKLVPCLPSYLLNDVPLSGYSEAPPFYGIWIYDMANQTQLPVVLAETGKLFSEAIALEKRSAPPAYIAPSIDLDLARENVGMLHIRSVYDLDGVFSRMGVNSAPTSLAAMAAAPADLRPARFIRLVKAVSVPDDQVLDDQDDNIYGNLMNGNRGIQEILGYAPIEPDGSVKVKVPADVAVVFEILDKDGKQISANHTNWLQLRPGETLECNGCHDAKNSSVIHGRRGLEPTAINLGAATAASFPNTQRYDALGAPKVPEMGQTMAQFAERSTYCENPADGTSCYPMAGPGQEFNLRSPQVDLVYRDEWSAPTIAKTPAFAYSYNQLVPGAQPDDIAAPTPTACRADQGWNANCRIVINYEYHIQPFWEREREPMTVDTLTATNCVSCHAPSADVMGTLVVKVPDGQLDLTRVKQAANRAMSSYIELTQGDNKQILNAESGLLEDELIPTGACNLDINDQPIVDENGVCTDPVLVTVPVSASMQRGSARGSSRFFNKFTAAGSHAGFLNNSELKLLVEWLDTGGRYYTNPFEMAIQN